MLLQSKETNTQSTRQNLHRIRMRSSENMWSKKHTIFLQSTFLFHRALMLPLNFSYICKILLNKYSAPPIGALILSYLILNLLPFPPNQPLSHLFFIRIHGIVIVSLILPLLCPIFFILSTRQFYQLNIS